MKKIAFLMALIMLVSCVSLSGFAAESAIHNGREGRELSTSITLWITLSIHPPWAS